MRREVDVELYTNNDSHCIYVTHPGHGTMRFVCQPQHHLASNAFEDDDHDGDDSFAVRTFSTLQLTTGACWAVAASTSSMMASYVILLQLAEVTLRKLWHG